ncbi:hypothetical protein E4T56_gene20237 [Termitomyces sp. T112]|nr:hypothetical protein E4T56_gene20237 [Termitomyces sp. T112]
MYTQGDNEIGMAQMTLKTDILRPGLWRFPLLLDGKNLEADFVADKNASWVGNEKCGAQSSRPISKVILSFIGLGHLGSFVLGRLYLHLHAVNQVLNILSCHDSKAFIIGGRQDGQEIA